MMDWGSQRSWRRWSMFVEACLWNIRVFNRRSKRRCLDIEGCLEIHPKKTTSRNVGFPKPFFFAIPNHGLPRKTMATKSGCWIKAHQNLQEYHANILARIDTFLSKHCKSHNPSVTLDAPKDPKNDTTLMGTCFSRLWWGDLVVKGERVLEDFV